MNNNPRNSLDFSETEKLGDNTLIEVMQEKNPFEASSKYVLIKHDYYSVDSDHGRKLLSAFLTSLCHSSFNSVVIYLVDSGTKLMDESNPLNDDMLRLLEKSESVILASESVEAYGVNVIPDDKITDQSIQSIAEDITYLSDLLTLE